MTEPSYEHPFKLPERQFRDVLISIAVWVGILTPYVLGLGLALLGLRLQLDPALSEVEGQATYGAVMLAFGLALAPLSFVVLATHDGWKAEKTSKAWRKYVVSEFGDLRRIISERPSETAELDPSIETRLANLESELGSLPRTFADLFRRRQR